MKILKYAILGLVVVSVVALIVLKTTAPKLEISLVGEVSMEADCRGFLTKNLQHEIKCYDEIISDLLKKQSKDTFDAGYRFNEEIDKKDQDIFSDLIFLKFIGSHKSPGSMTDNSIAYAMYFEDFKKRFTAIKNWDKEQTDFRWNFEASVGYDLRSLTEEQKIDLKKKSKEMNEKYLKNLIEDYKSGVILKEGGIGKLSLIYIVELLEEKSISWENGAKVVEPIYSSFYSQLSQEDKDFVLNFREFRREEVWKLKQKINDFNFNSRIFVWVCNKRDKPLSRFSFEIVGYEYNRSTPRNLLSGKENEPTKLADDAIVQPNTCTGVPFKGKYKFFDRYEIKNTQGFWN